MCVWPDLSASSVTGEPRIDIDRPSENEATDERPSDAFIRWNVSATITNCISRHIPLYCQSKHPNRFVVKTLIVRGKKN